MIELQYGIQTELRDKNGINKKQLIPYSGTFLGLDLFEATQKANEWYNKNRERIEKNKRELILTTPIKDPICKDYDSVLQNAIEKPGMYTDEQIEEYLKAKI